MKKVGNILLSLIPFFMILAVQFMVSFVYALVYMILKGKMVENLMPIVAISHLLTVVIAFIWYYIGFGKLGKINSKNVFTAKMWIVIVTFSVSLQCLIQVGFMLLSLLTPDLVEAYSEAIEQSGLTELGIISIVVTLIFAPIGEEICFRGITYKYLRRAGVGFAVANIVQALLFGIMHMQPLQAVYAAILGLFLGYVHEKYQTIYVPIFMHGIFNFLGTYGVSLFEDTEQTAFKGIVYLVIGICFLVLGIIVVKRDKNVQKAELEESINE